MRQLFILLVSGLFLNGCDSLCNCDNDEGNHAPALQDILLNPAEVVALDLIYLTAIATDEDGDSLQYSWTTTGGEIEVYREYTTTSNPTRWRAPADPGNHSISCTVNDGKETATKSVAVTVQ